MLIIFRKKHDVKERLISLDEVKDFQRFLIEQVFNGGEVGFDLYYLEQYLCLKKGDDKAISSLPSSFSWLVKDIISSVLSHRDCLDVSILKRDFVNILKTKELSEIYFDFLALIVQDELKIEEFYSLQRRLKYDIWENSSITDGKRSLRSDELVTEEQVKDLQRFFNDNFFKKWLLKFDSKDLGKIKRSSKR